MNRTLKRYTWCVVLCVVVVTETGHGLAWAFQQQPPLRVNWQVQQTLLVSGNQPQYPPLAAMALIQGPVHLQFTVNKDGSANNVKVVSGHPLLIQAAIDAVRTWRFKPAIVNGVPTEIQTIAVVNFFRPGQSPTSYLAPFIKEVARKPNDAKAHENLARELLRIGQINESIEEFQKTIALNPNIATLHFGLAEALGTQGNVDAAIQEYRQGLFLNPKDAGARFGLASWLEISGDVDNAIGELRAGLQLRPKASDRRFNLARLLFQKGEIDAAIVEYRRRCVILPAFPAPIMVLEKRSKEKAILMAP